MSPFFFVFGSAAVGLFAEVLAQRVAPTAAPALMLFAMGGALLAASRRTKVKAAIREAGVTAAAAVSAGVVNASAVKIDVEAVKSAGL